MAMWRTSLEDRAREVSVARRVSMGSGHTLMAASRVALILGLVGAIALASLGERGVQAAQAGQVGRACPSACVAGLRYEAAPQLLLAGEVTTVSLNLKFVCPGIAEPMHVMLAIDQSADLDSNDMRQVSDAMKWVVGQLALSKFPSTQVGIVEAPGEIRTLAELTNDEAVVQRAIGRIAMSGEAQLAGLIEAAGRSLQRGQVRDCYSRSQDVLIILAADGDFRACPEALRAARMLKQQGVLVVVICFGMNCGSPRCLRELPTSHRHFGVWMNSTDKSLRFLERVRGDPNESARLQAWTVIERLPATSKFELGSASPPAIWDPTARTLTWQQDFMPKDGVTMSYRTQPLKSGLVPASRGLDLWWRDSENGQGSRRLEAVWVQVFGAPLRVP